MRPAYYNDNDPYCCAVLRKQITAGNLPPGDVDERDIRDVTAGDVAGYGQKHLFAGIGGFPLGLRWAGVSDGLDIITGGFPCQPHSLAGKRKASADTRDLWPEFARLIRDLRPRWVLAENVPGLLSSEAGRYFGRVLGDLAASGYDAEWQCVSAAAVGALHIRDRVFILAYPNDERRSRRHDPLPGNMLHGRYEATGQGATNFWAGAAVTDVCGVAHGIPRRVDRLGALGNAVVPQVVAVFGAYIQEVEARLRGGAGWLR